MIKDQLVVVPAEHAHREVATSRLAFARRKSVLLRLHLAGASHVGEASPLDGFGDDSYELAHGELLLLDLAFMSSALTSAHRSARPLEAIADAAKELRSPAARFALETCLVRRYAFESGVPPWMLLRAHLGLPKNAPGSLPSCMVLDPLSPETLRTLELAHHRGVRTFKVKTGRDFDTEIAFAERTVAEYEGLRLRIDPNQAWSPYELEKLAAYDLPLDWIEDPTSDPTEWGQWATRFRFAIDEILLGEEPRSDLLQSAAASVVILKPMALGGYSVALAWAREAWKIGCDASVSHLFDGPFAFDAVADLAFAVQSGDFAPGLGLHVGLDGWNERPRSLTDAEIVRLDG